MIQEGGLQVQVYRFGSVIVHILPYIAIQAQWPLEVVLVLYSVSFTLLYLGLYLLITRWLKNDYLGLVLVFLFTLLVYDGFYWATSEFQQGLAFTVFFFAFLLKYPEINSIGQKLFVFVFVPTLVFFHPLMFVPFFFFLFFFWLKIPKLRNRQIYFTVLFFVLVMVFKHFFAGNWYDTGKFDQFRKALKDYFPNYLSMPVNQKFMINTLKYWYFFPVFFGIVETWYLLKKQYLSAGLVLLVCLGYLALIHIGSPNATYRFYVEVSYMPLSMFVMTPFFFDVVHKIQTRWIITFLVVILAFRLAVIALNHQPYTERLGWINERIEQGRTTLGGHLFVMDNSSVIEEKTIISWGVAYESILLSALKTPEHPSCLLILQRKEQYEEELKTDDFLLTTFKQFPFEEVSNPYFRFSKEKFQRMPD